MRSVTSRMDETWTSALCDHVTRRATLFAGLMGLLTILVSDVSGSSKLAVTCKSEAFVANCSAKSSTATDGSANDIILIESAQYGRMRTSRCATGSFAIGCAANVTWYIDRKCSGRRNCRVSVPDPVLNRLDECHVDLSSFLEVRYSCVTASPGGNPTALIAECRQSGHLLLTVGSNRDDDVTQQQSVPAEAGSGSRSAVAGYGYISSETAIATGIGTNDCPFRIKAAEGQRIRLTMVAFAGGRRQSDSPSAADGGTSSGSDSEQVPSGNLGSVAGGSGNPLLTDTTCYEVGTASSMVKTSESTSGLQKHPLTACSLPSTTVDRRTASGSSGSAGTVRQPVSVVSSSYVLYEADNNEVIVQLNPRTVLQELAPFVIKYEALGCESLRAPAGGWMRTEKDLAVTFGCNTTTDTWRFQCNVNEWALVAGRPVNCSQHTALTWRSNSMFGQEDEFPYRILIVVAIGVALGVFIGGTLLSVVAFCMKKQAASEAASFNPCETESLQSPGTYNGCSYHPTQQQQQHYQHQLQQHLQRMPPPPSSYHTASIDPAACRYRTVCYPAGAGGSATPPAPPPPPADDYDLKGGLMSEEPPTGGRFVLDSYVATHHHYESPHFNGVGAVTGGSTFGTTPRSPPLTTTHPLFSSGGLQQPLLTDTSSSIQQQQLAHSSNKMVMLMTSP